MVEAVLEDVLSVSCLVCFAVEASDIGGFIDYELYVT